MANDVFANSREISCKKADGKSIAAFPDVCMTAPVTGLTPMGVPIPYPNTGMAKDTSNGSRSVKITGKEIIKKNVSYYKTSYGDEAGTATPAKKGIITGTIKGKVYFTTWSMDVKIEGQNAVRHLDLTTHNHNSQIGNESIPWPHVDTMSMSTADLPKKPCNKECPKKASKSDYDKARRKSPSPEIRKKINSEQENCAACGDTPKNLAADHIVPLKIIVQMPGFACLSNEDQKKIANTPENYIGLCKSCNSSKRDKLWHTWKGHKKRGLDWQSEKYKENRETARKTTNKLLKNFKAKIRSIPCE